MKTSIVVATRNRAVSIIQFLNSLYEQSQKPHELIIIDSSNEPLINNHTFKDIIQKLHKNNITIIFKRSAPGLTYQRNIGVSYTTGDIIYFFDDDVILTSDYLTEMNKIFKKYSYYGGGMGTAITHHSQWSINRLLRIIFLMQREGSSGKFTSSGMPTHTYGNTQFCEVEVLGGCCMAFKKEIFNEYKFDENLRFYSYMEDCDFSKRVSLKYKLFYNPKAKLNHLHSPLARDKVIDNRAMYIKNYSYLFFKNFYHSNPLKILLYCWTILGLFCEALLIRNLSYFKGYYKGLLWYYKKKF